MATVPSSAHTNLGNYIKVVSTVLDLGDTQAGSHVINIMSLIQSLNFLRTACPFHFTDFCLSLTD